MTATLGFQNPSLDIIFNFSSLHFRRVSDYLLGALGVSAFVVYDLPVLFYST